MQKGYETIFISINRRPFKIRCFTSGREFRNQWAAYV